MTYRYCQLAQGRNLPAERGIEWNSIHAVIPLDELGNEIACNNEMDEMRLWCLKVISYDIADGVMYVRLERRCVNA